MVKMLISGKNQDMCRSYDCALKPCGETCDNKKNKRKKDKWLWNSEVKDAI